MRESRLFLILHNQALKGVLQKRLFQRAALVKSVHIGSFFWSVFSCIRSEYGHLHRKSPYSVRMQENTGQKKLCIWTPFTQCFWRYYMLQNSHFLTLLVAYWAVFLIAKGTISFDKSNWTVRKAMDDELKPRKHRT